MLPTISQHAKSHLIFPKKNLGQNFLYDKSLCDKIAKSANITENDIILEIGPGVGGLTRSILSFCPKKLIAIEKDSRCINLLMEIQSQYPSLTILDQDALKVEISSLWDIFELDPKDKIKIVANLPYNIATLLITNCLQNSNKLSQINVLVQKEVAERIVSAPSKKSYGRLSIFCQILSDPHILFNISPDAFYPKPKIWSSFVTLKPKAGAPSPEALELLSHVTHLAFSMRRKKLKTSLKDYLALSNKLEQSKELRPENIAPSEYLEITEEIISSNPSKYYSNQ
ncbi:MAG: 16S rRNA (adenine(1518)-N(6)/adenine(1519)-N(6))-dimethyltransferase RsmA [Rickettsiaceae bacterium]|nr:16S rRNA (adenine(1518)-N(6)/adenine(1519)-N(6))-dimethyltransferase RsmA [Rickettsiaceae bacterium]